MVTAVMLLKVDKRKVNDIGEILAGVEGVHEVYSVAGEYDLVVVVRVKDNESVAELITGHMLQIEGIESSETLIAFRKFSPDYEV